MIIINPYRFSGSPPPAGSYADEVAADSPLAWWRLDETSGTAAADSSGNGRNGTYAGGSYLAEPSLVAGSPYSVAFDGADGRMTVAHASWMDVTSAITVECWVNFHATPDNLDAIIARAYTSDQIAFLLDVASGKFRWGHYDMGAGPAISGTTTIAALTTYHVVGVKDATHYRIYVNGVEEANVADATALPVNAGALGLAFLQGIGRYTLTKMDEVAIYGTALSAARILAHYNAA